MSDPTATAAALPLLLVEDDQVEEFGPLTRLRPAFELRLGALSLRERAELVATTVRARVRPTLGPALAESLPELAVEIEPGSRVLAVNARCTASAKELAALLARANRMVDRWGGPGVYFSRWLVSPLGPWINFIAGGAGLERLRFTLWDIAGEATWVALYVTLGYVFSSNLTALTELVSNWAGLISAAAVAVFAGSLLLRRAIRDRRGGKRRAA